MDPTVRADIAGAKQVTPEVSCHARHTMNKESVPGVIQTSEATAKLVDKKAGKMSLDQELQH